MRLSIHLLAIVLLNAVLPAALAADDLLAFPEAQGAAARTPGGRGGKILRVTTLAPSGPGSLLAALEADGPRIVVFEVGGVIDFARQEIKITRPYLTVAGQTAPSPGITLIRTGIDVLTHDVVVQHMRVRTGSAEAPQRGGWEPDAFSTQAAHDVIVPIAKGSIIYPQDDPKKREDGPYLEAAEVIETPKGNATNNPSIRIDWLTGRVRVVRPEKVDYAATF